MTENINKRLVKDYSNQKRLQVAAKASEILAKGGINAIAASLSSPVKYTMDTVGIMRDVYAVITNYPKGMPFFVEKDLDRFYGVLTAQEGGVYSITQKPTREYVNEMPIQSRTYVNQSDLYTRTYDVLERSKERLVEGLTIREELLLLSLTSAACNSSLGNPVVSTGGALDKAVLARAFSKIETQNLAVDNIITNPSGMSGIRRIDWTNLDQKGMQETRETGYLGTLWGASFKSSYLVAAGRNYVTCSMINGESYFGEYFIREDVLVQPLNEPHMARVGFSGYMLGGMIVHNAKGAVEVQFSPTA